MESFNEFEFFDLKKDLNRKRVMAAIDICAEIIQLGGVKYMNTKEIDARLGTGLDSKILRRVLTQKEVSGYRRGGNTIGYGVNDVELGKLLAVVIRLRDQLEANKIHMNKIFGVQTQTICAATPNQTEDNIH